jgi:solute carrier family 25 S-adenosylmethionine transporter 26
MVPTYSVAIGTMILLLEHRTPMEVIKNKLQVGAGAEGLTTKATSSLSTMGLVRDIFKKDGIPGFFRGYWISLGVFVPYTVW